MDEKNNLDSSLSFYRAAAGMHKNPLGLIALFIVMVYAIGALALWGGGEVFYSNPYHPVVLFLAVFPVFVLAVFYFLVAKYHTHLYAPGDFINQSHFLEASAPKSLARLSTGAATSDNSKASVDSVTSVALLSHYQNMLDFGVIMLHEVEVLRPITAPRNGLFRVRVWIESIGPEMELTDVSSVTYQLWHDFPTPQMTTLDHRSSFDLWLKIYGEFPVMAIITKKNGEQAQLVRYINLPGRPED